MSDALEINIDDYFPRMKPYIQGKHWEKLEADFGLLCKKLSGEAYAARIARIDLDPYRQGLRAGLVEAMMAANRHDARAIYYQYDMGDRWRGRFLVCLHYRPAAKRDEAWSFNWMANIEGPVGEALWNIYCEHGFDDGSIAVGNTLYLVARTVSVMGRAMTGFGLGKLLLCMGFHDQDPIVRMNVND